MIEDNIYYPKTLDELILHPFVFDNEEKLCSVVDIVGEEYSICEQASQGSNFWGNSKPGAYGAGLGRTENDPFKPARTGLLGQMAYGKIFGGPVDLVYRKGGDSYDSLFNNIYKIDIKCSMNNYGKGLIYHTNEWGRHIPLNKDIYVFGFVSSENRQEQFVRIIMVGFALRSEVEQCPVYLGIRGNGHKNYEISYSSLHSVIQLLLLQK